MKGGLTILTALEVVEHDMETFTVLTVIFDNHASAADDLAGIALTIDFAQSCPSTENLGISDLDEVDLVLGAQSLDKLDVLRLSAALDENSKVSLALVQGLGTLAQTTGETIVHEGILQDLLYKRSVSIDSKGVQHALEGHPR